MRGRCDKHDLAFGPSGCVLCRREGAVSPAAGGSTGAFAPVESAVARASTADPVERRFTLRLPPIVLTVPLLALAAFGVIRTEPWRPSPSTPGAGEAATASAAREALADDTDGSAEDESAAAPRVDTRGEPEPMAPSEPAVDLVNAAVDFEPARTEDGPAAMLPLQQRADDEPKQAAQLALARAREQVEVVVYYAQWCGYCTKARAYLAQRGIRSVEHDIDSDPGASGRHRRINPRGSVPTIEIDGQVLVGFDPRGMERAIDRAARARLQRDRGS